MNPNTQRSNHFFRYVHVHHTENNWETKVVVYHLVCFGWVLLDNWGRNTRRRWENATISWTKSWIFTLQTFSTCKGMCLFIEKSRPYSTFSFIRGWKIRNEIVKWSKRRNIMINIFYCLIKMLQQNLTSIQRNVLPLGFIYQNNGFGQLQRSCTSSSH